MQLKTPKKDKSYLFGCHKNQMNNKKKPLNVYPELSTRYFMDNALNCSIWESTKLSERVFNISFIKFGMELFIVYLLYYPEIEIREWFCHWDLISVHILSFKDKKGW